MKCLKPKTEKLIDYINIVVRGLTIPCVVTTSNGDIIKTNDSLCKLFGYCYGELFNQNIKILMPSEIANKHDKYMDNYFTGNNSGIVGDGRKLSAVHINGTLIDIHLSVSVMKVPFTIFIATIQDISKLLSLERVRKSMEGSMPTDIIDSIWNTPVTCPRVTHFVTHSNTCIIFCDIVGFSIYCKNNTPNKIGEMLHEIFSIIDNCIDEYQLEKIRTIGDGYIITSGVFNKYIISNKPLIFAKKVINECIKLDIKIRIGIHLGNIVSGIVGQKSNQFDIYGHDVNIAARLEQTCTPGYIHVSEQLFDSLVDIVEYDKKITEMKNMGEINSIMIPVI